eukprot:gene4514-8555_t
MSQLYMNVDNPRGKVCKPILTVSLTDFPWLHGPIGRAEVQQLIDDNGNREGLFLVRESTRVPGSYVLSCVALGTVQHYIIQDEGGVYRIDDGPPFSCLEDLIDHYHKPDDRLPTVLTTYCPRPGALPAINQQESYENMWNAQHTAQAQVASSKPIATQQPAVFSATQQMKSMTLQYTMLFVFNVAIIHISHKFLTKEEWPTRLVWMHVSSGARAHSLLFLSGNELPGSTGR